MLPGDNEEAGQRAGERFAEARAAHYWDGERHLAKHIAHALNIGPRASLGRYDAEPIAWDVYLAFGRQASAVARPDFWMHRLAVTHAPLFDAARWEQHIRRLISGGSPT